MTEEAKTSIFKKQSLKSIKSLRPDNLPSPPPQKITPNTPSEKIEKPKTVSQKFQNLIKSKSFREYASTGKISPKKGAKTPGRNVN